MSIVMCCWSCYVINCFWSKNQKKLSSLRYKTNLSLQHQNSSLWSMPNQFRQINNRVMHDIIDLITGNGVTFYEQIYLNATRRETLARYSTESNRYNVQHVCTYSTKVKSPWNRWGSVWESGLVVQHPFQPLNQHFTFTSKLRIHHWNLANLHHGERR